MLRGLLEDGAEDGFAVLDDDLEVDSAVGAVFFLQLLGGLAERGGEALVADGVRGFVLLAAGLDVLRVELAGALFGVDALRGRDGVGARGGSGCGRRSGGG